MTTFSLHASREKADRALAAQPQHGDLQWWIEPTTDPDYPYALMNAGPSEDTQIVWTKVDRERSTAA